MFGPSVGTTYYERVTDICGAVVNCGGKSTSAVESSNTVSLDATAPTITAPASISITGSPNNNCNAAGVFATPGYSDACSVGASAQDDVVSTISNLKLWTRADAGVITDGTGKVAQWTDLSGNGNHFKQNTFANRPTLTASNSSFNKAIRN